jgi:hypothetical protein
MRNRGWRPTLSRRSGCNLCSIPRLVLGFKAWQVGVEAQSVVALRMMRLAAGGARAEAEASRMVVEKVLAAGEAQAAIVAAATRGDKDHVVAGKALNVYRKRVRKNRRRLSRRSRG